MERESTKEAALAFAKNGGRCVRRCKYGTDCYEPISVVNAKDLLKYYSFDNRVCRLLWMDVLFGTNCVRIWNQAL